MARKNSQPDRETARQSDLPAAELEVLTALWDQGPASVREVMNILARQGRDLAYTTVLTFLTRLEQRGFVASDRSAVAYVYRAVVSRERVTRTRLRAMLETFYDGAAGPLVLQLVREKRLSAQEIAELQQLIESLDANEPPKRTARKRRGRADG